MEVNFEICTAGTACVEPIHSWTISCQQCENSWHLECLETRDLSRMIGDSFFELICSKCSKNKEPTLVRVKLSWQNVVHLALYNLHLQSSGKRGYHKWREHICLFIDKHWEHFFGKEKKRSGNWRGVVAGVLSSCDLFVSGQNELKEVGWWKLARYAPPTMEGKTGGKRDVKRVKPSTERVAEQVTLEPRRHGNRRRPPASLDAAMQLKARRDTISPLKRKRRRREIARDSSSDDEQPHDVTRRDAHVTSPRTKIVYSESVKAILGDASSDSDIDPCAMSPDVTSYNVDQCDNELLASTSNLPDQPESNSSSQQTTLCSDITVKQEKQEPAGVESSGCDYPLPGGVIIKQEVVDDGQYVPHDRDLVTSSGLDVAQDRNMVTSRGRDVPQDSDTDTAASDCESFSESFSADYGRQRYVAKRVDGASASKPQERRTTAAPAGHQQHDEDTKPQRTLVAMKPHEERALLRHLQSRVDVTHADASTVAQQRRLMRKLHIRQLKRERNLPLFDLDQRVNDVIRRKCELYGQPYNDPAVLPSQQPRHDPQRAAPANILDRFQMPGRVQRPRTDATLMNMLVGSDDTQLQRIHSPYTSRLLKPFIRRDYESRPLKLRLLQQITAHVHRNDATWRPPPVPPIDYCYLQPQHVTAVNALCREFFWPGIDVSEVLQYPDFSCVVLYRKCVIGFAFMVPDVKYNEAYISFIFTHPEWRRGGIATFMLYHLIQTCMGKDVTLHVSASNPAMMLYQKFGFKAEQLILDFYDKYFATDSKDCRHAFFLRLKR